MVRNMADIEGSRLVTVSCADHGKWIANALSNLFDSKRGTDFELRWGDKSTKAHRVILELFLAPETIARDGYKQEVSDDETGYGNNILDALLEFLYKGQVAVQEEQLENLLRIAKDLNFHMLVDAILQPGSAMPDGCSENVDGGNCSPIDENGCRTVSPMYYSSQEFGEPHIGNFLNDGEGHNLESDTDPGCSSSDQFLLQANMIKVELGGVSEEELSEPEEGVIRPADPTSLQYGSLNDDAGPSFSESRNPEVEDDSSSSGIGVDKNTEASEAGRLFTCPHCEFITSKYSGYYSHLLSAHEMTVRGKPAPKYQCTDCDYSSGRIDSLKRHQRCKHSNEKPYACQHCSYVGNIKNSLVKHMYVAHGLGSSRFQCKTCGQRCGRLYDLKEHTLIHTNERPFKCTQCSFASNAKRNLTKHILNKH